jgi:predicted ATPase
MFVARAYVPEHLRPGPAERHRWPFTVPAVAQLLDEGLGFTAPVSFLVGDNGSGNTTLRSDTPTG